MSQYNKDRSYRVNWEEAIKTIPQFESARAFCFHYKISDTTLYKNLKKRGLNFEALKKKAV